jgi:tetratricopeptide (TPR) repeat protein
MRRQVLPLLLAVIPTVCLAAGELERARKLYTQMSYREAIQALAPLASSSDPAVHETIGKSWFALAEYKKAQESFEKAVALAPSNAVYYHWLGKALGRRAETSNPLSAPMLASKARQNFEKAVELDGRNAEAINDLFSYYLEAPGFLGGGLDKAAALAKRIEALDKVEYHYALAQLAEKRKEFKTAEFHFRQAFSMAPRSVGRAVDLARFLSNQGRTQESEAVFAQAAKIAPDNPRLLFERASAYVKAKRNLDEARLLLQRYLQAPLGPDDPPRAEAQRLLKQAGA